VSQSWPAPASPHYGSPTPPRAAAPMRRTQTFAAQAKTKGGHTAVSKQYRCSKCAITYDVAEGDRAHCPMCEVEKQLKTTQLYLQEALEKVDGLQRQLSAMGAQVDHVSAIRQALDIISSEDLAWLKGVMYRYRVDKSLTLMSMHLEPRISRKASDRKIHNAFALVERGRDNDTYQPASPGGIAIVGYYQEITRELGQKQAMAYLLRALSMVLTGGAPA